MRGPIAQAFRSARRDPWYTFSVVLTLGLGIGASTSAFNVLDRLVLRGPSQTTAADNLRRIAILDLPSSEVPKAAERNSLSYPEYGAVVRALSTEGTVAGYFDWPGEIPIRLHGEPRRARVLGVTTNYFAVLGVRPSYGRFFAQAVPLFGPMASPSEVVISDAFWDRAFRRQTDALGAIIEAYHQRFVVVGVAPRGFDGLGLDGPDIWLSGEHDLAELYGAEWRRARNAAVWSVVLRISDATDGIAVPNKARAALIDEATAAGSQMRYGQPRLLTLQQSLGVGFSREIRLAWALWGVSTILLLISSINAGSLFLVRGLERQQTYALAYALGASRGRMIRSLVVEGLILSAAAVLVGTLFAFLGGEVIRRGIGAYIHYTHSILDLRPLAYASLLGVIVGILASVLPAARATRADLRTLLDDRGFGSRKDIGKLRALIHTAQIAFAVIGLYGASLFVHSGQRARNVSLGIDIDDVVIATANVMAEGLSKDEARVFWSRVLTRMPTGGPIQAVSLSSLPVLREYAPSVAVTAMDAASVSDSGTQATLTVITPSYNKSLGVDIVAGRDLAESDVSGGLRVALINRAGAKALFRVSAPLDRCVMLVRKPEECLRIVGVVNDSRRAASDDQSTIQLYVPWSQSDMPVFPYLIVRASPGMIASVRSQIQRVLASETPPATQVDIRSLRSDWESATAHWVRSGQLITVLGGIAIGLTFFGIYGSLTYDLLRRRREFGVRIALGAEPNQLFRGVLRTALAWCLAGLILGLLGSMWLALGVRGLLFATDPWDPTSLVLASVATLSIVATAAWIGARRAGVRDAAFLLRASQ